MSIYVKHRLLDSVAKSLQRYLGRVLAISPRVTPPLIVFICIPRKYVVALDEGGGSSFWISNFAVL